MTLLNVPDTFADLTPSLTDPFADLTPSLDTFADLSAPRLTAIRLMKHIPLPSLPGDEIRHRVRRFSIVGEFGSILTIFCLSVTEATEAATWLNRSRDALLSGKLPLEGPLPPMLGYVSSIRLRKYAMEEHQKLRDKHLNHRKNGRVEYD